MNPGTDRFTLERAREVAGHETIDDADGDERAARFNKASWRIT